MSGREWQAPSYEPRSYYGCPVSGQIPVILENVRRQQRSMVIVGPASVVALSALGVAGMTLHARKRQKQLEGQVRYVPASGNVILLEDRIRLHLEGAGKAGRIRFTNDPASRTVDCDIPYGLIKRWGTEPKGVYLDVVGSGVIWLRPQDGGEFSQWLAHLSHGMTWSPPTPLELRQEVAWFDWCRQDSRFTFGIPEGWVNPYPQALAQNAQQLRPHALRAGVVSADGDWEPQVLVIEVAGDDAQRSTDIESMVIDCVAATNVSPIGPINTVSVGGQEGALLRGVSSTMGGVFDRTYVHTSRHGVHYVLWFGVLGGQVHDGSHERWLPHFHTMLATWQWLI